MAHPDPKLPLTAVPRAHREVSGQRVITDADGNDIAYVGFDEDAEYLVRAANAIGWLQEMHTLHRTVEMLYVVHGYQVTICHDCHPISPDYHGATILDAIDKARAEFDADSIPKRNAGKSTENFALDMLAAAKVREAVFVRLLTEARVSLVQQSNVSLVSDIDAALHAARAE